MVQTRLKREANLQRGGRFAGVVRLRPDLAKAVIPRSYGGRNGHTDRDARADFGPNIPNGCLYFVTDAPRSKMELSGGPNFETDR
jgi:hypothetical protein